MQFQHNTWKRWLSWAMRCRLEPVKEAARMVKSHLWGILNAIVLGISNGPAESLNSRIKMKNRGYRNKERFINEIYFHLDGLELYPQGANQQVYPRSVVKLQANFAIENTVTHPI